MLVIRRLAVISILFFMAFLSFSCRNYAFAKKIANFAYFWSILWL